MRLFVLAAAAAVASFGLNGCTSPGYYNGGYYNSGYYSGAPYAPGAVEYPGYGVPPPEAPPMSAYGAYVPPRAGSYGSARPQVYSAPQSPPAPARYSGPYKPQVYSGPTRPSPGDQSYGRAYRQ
jgi:hypothetical protein